jgi:transcriptional regulator with XRE-family HTH domain
VDKTNDRNVNMPEAITASSIRPEEARTILAANLRRLRKERGWSQEMLAHFAGLHPTEISRLERGLREPRLRTVVQMAGALRVPVQDLIDKHESPAHDEVEEG